MSRVAASSATRGPAGAGCWLNVALVDGMGTAGHLVPGRSASTATTDSVPLAHSPSLDGLPQKIAPAVAVLACPARALHSDGSATGCIHRVTRRVDSVDVPGAAVVPSPCSVGVDEGDRCVAESSFPKQSAASKYRAAFVASHHDMGLQALSTDLLQHVLSFLTAADWGAARATSRSLCAVAESPAALDAMFANSVALPRLGRSLGACLSIIRFVNPAAWAVDVELGPEGVFGPLPRSQQRTGRRLGAGGLHGPETSAGQGSVAGCDDATHPSASWFRGRARLTISPICGLRCSAPGGGAWRIPWSQVLSVFEIMTGDWVHVAVRFHYCNGRGPGSRDLHTGTGCLRISCAAGAPVPTRSFHRLPAGLAARLRASDAEELPHVRVARLAAAIRAAQHVAKLEAAEPPDAGARLISLHSRMVCMPPTSTRRRVLGDVVVRLSAWWHSFGTKPPPQTQPQRRLQGCRGT